MSTFARRQFLIGSAVLVGSAALGRRTARAAGTSPLAAGNADAVADTYYTALVKNTPIMEASWDSTLGAYSPTNDTYIGVLGNAVMLRFGDFDPDVAGVDEATLHDHTLRTIAHYAATNYYDGGSEWGRPLFWNATYVVYFSAAANLLWGELSDTTRQQIGQLLAGTANYDGRLGTGDDPASPGWTTNGLPGGYVGDTKLEEMGNKGMAFAGALAYLPDDPGAPGWRQWLDTWMSNMTGLPVDDENNPTVVNGRTVAQRNSAQNMWPGYLVENHGAYAPHYHQSAFVYPARDAVGFVLTGQEIPATLLAQPNGAGLYRTMRNLASSAGMSTHPMVADRFHLYGRDVLPLAGRYLLHGDALAGRAELMLAQHLIPYVDYAPAGRLTKFSGQPSYEPEARAEVGMAYLLHYYRAALPGGTVDPVSEEAFFAASTATRDWGPDVGLLAQQSSGATALAVTKPGYVKFAWLPGHDDWLFDPSGQSAFFTPNGLTVHGRDARTYSRVRDGYDATATVLAVQHGQTDGYVGFATLPDGSAVYATTGLADPEGAISVFNLDMPGVPGLDGDRTFHGAGDTITLAAADLGAGLGDGYLDVVTFPAVSGRYLRMLGVRPATQYGYSVYTFAVRDGANGPDLALGAPATASSNYPGFPPGNVTDGDDTTRWAVSSAGRSDPASWLAVDLGAMREFDRVEIRWEEQAAYGKAYRVQVSADGLTWTDVASVNGDAGQTIEGTWLNVDDRAGFVVTGSTNPIQVGPNRIALSAGPISGSAQLTVRALPGSAADTAAAARQPQPTSQVATLRAALVADTLVLLNLAAQPVTGSPVVLPAPARTLYDGAQTIDTAGRITYLATMAAGTGRTLAPRFLAAVSGVGVDVVDSTRVLVTNNGTAAVGGRLTAVGSGQSVRFTVAPGERETVRFDGTAYPVADLATGRPTYPDSPLPPGTTSPGFAVDGDDSTSWLPGPNGRMVVDLGGIMAVDAVQPRWQGGGGAPNWTVAVSDDGLSFTAVAQGTASQQVHIGLSTRYVALAVVGSPAPGQGVVELRVLG